MGAAACSPVVGRFAPSPTGRMHAGNIFSALMCWLVVRLQGGRIVLRIEDLDEQRSRGQHADLIMRDLESLGLTWDEGPYFQSSRSERYREALADLEARGLLYPCFCTRADLHAASAPHDGHGLVYAGTCRNLTLSQRAERLEQRRSSFADPQAAAAYEPASRLRCADERIVVDDLFQGVFERDLATECGDFVVRRSNGEASYNLAVVVDDAEQGVNCIVRGCDLLPATPQQMHLQRLLGFDEPAYAHIPLLVDERGARLAKRQKSASMEELLARCGSPAAVLGRIAHATGLIAEEQPCMPEELLGCISLEELAALFRGRTRILFTE